AGPPRTSSLLRATSADRDHNAGFLSLARSAHGVYRKVGLAAFPPRQAHANDRAPVPHDDAPSPPISSSPSQQPMPEMPSNAPAPAASTVVGVDRVMVAIELAAVAAEKGRLLQMVQELPQEDVRAALTTHGVDVRAKLDRVVMG